MKKIAEEFNNCFVGIGKTKSNSIGTPVKKFEAHLKGNYPVTFSCILHKNTEI